MNTPRLITKRQVIMSVPRRWREQYTPKPFYGTMSVVSDDKYRKAEDLDRLDVQSASEKDIEAIIGNGSWTRMQCDQCNREVETLVVVGQEPDIESRTASLCPDCVKAAFDVLRASPPEAQQARKSV